MARRAPGAKKSASRSSNQARALLHRSPGLPAWLRKPISPERKIDIIGIS